MSRKIRVLPVCDRRKWAASIFGCSKMRIRDDPLALILVGKGSPGSYRPGTKVSEL
jgi:hypothetical protein